MARQKVGHVVVLSEETKHLVRLTREQEQRYTTERENVAGMTSYIPLCWCPSLTPSQ